MAESILTSYAKPVKLGGKSMYTPLSEDRMQAIDRGYLMGEYSREDSL